MVSVSSTHVPGRLSSKEGDQQDAGVQTARNASIVIRGLTKQYAASTVAVTAIDGINLEIGSGEFVCIVGPSGCGKTTLLRILAGLEEPSSGSVKVDIPDAGDVLQSMVFQESGVFPWMTAIDNVGFGMRVRGVSKSARNERSRHFLKKLGLGKFERAYPHQLSGGMRQRVNIARAFANDPALLLMDEPLASLDEQTKMLVQEDLLQLWEGSGKIVVFITHSLDEAIILADRVVVMSARPGNIKSIVDIDLPRPRSALELRNDPRFMTIRKHIWEALREEVLAARGTDA